MVTEEPDSPHLMAFQIKCASYFACAEIDKWAPPADIQKLEVALKQAKANYRIEWYPQTEHGFVFPQRAGMYNAKAAERHWERLFHLFERTLKLSA
jgi:carboxymethylenebutenolidase